MNFEEARARLQELARMSGEEQQQRREEIIKTFLIFWRSNPSMSIFGETCREMVLFPELLWIMVKQG